MSVEHIYNKAKEKKECRVCGKRTEELSRGRCRDCSYKNLEPIE